MIGHHIKYSHRHPVQINDAPNTVIRHLHYIPTSREIIATIRCTCDSLEKTGRCFNASILSLSDSGGADSRHPILSHTHLPGGVLWDRNRKIYIVADWIEQTQQGRLAIFDSTYRFRSYLRIEQDERIAGLAFLDDDHILVADFHSHSVAIISIADGSWIDFFGEKLLKAPCSVAVDSKRNRILVLDYDPCCVYVFDKTSFTLLTKFNVGHGCCPEQILVDASGAVAIATAIAMSVIIFNAEDYSYRGTILCKGQVSGVALDASGKLYVAVHGEGIDIYTTQ